jgi:hypothetical protein
MPTIQEQIPQRWTVVQQQREPSSAMRRVSRGNQ